MPIIKYNFKGEIIDSNVLGNTPQELAAGFGLISDLNPRVTNKIKHIAISFAREDLGKLDEKQMVLLGHEYLVKMGYGNCPYTMFYHDEIRHNHDHFHICVSTIDYSGKKVDDTYEKYRSMEIERKLEEKYKLKPNIGRNTKKGLRREELAFKKRTNTAKLNKEIIREKIDTVIKESGSFADFVTKLKDTNPPIICEPTYQSTGRISGVKFSFNGHFCTGSSLGKGYSYLAIENQILRQKRQLIPKKTWPKMATDATKTQIIAPEPTFGFSSFPISALQQDEDRTMEIEEMLRKKKKKRRTL